jgi:hypothetical protein
MSKSVDYPRGSLLVLTPQSILRIMQYLGTAFLGSAARKIQSAMVRDINMSGCEIGFAGVAYSSL